MRVRPRRSLPHPPVPHMHMAALWPVAQSTCWWVSWPRCRVSLAWRRSLVRAHASLGRISVPLGPPALAVLVSACRGSGPPWLMSYSVTVMIYYRNSQRESKWKQIMHGCSWAIRWFIKTHEALHKHSCPIRTLSRLLARSDVLLLSLETRFLMSLETAESRNSGFWQSWGVCGFSILLSLKCFCC